MNPSFLREFGWFRNMDSGHKHRVAFAIPGLVYGINTTVLDFIEDVRFTLKQETIDLYIFTWDIPFNRIWVNKLQQLCNGNPHSKYKFIRLHIELGNYETSTLPALAKDIATELGVDFEKEQADFYFSRSNFKRLVNAYVHFKTFYKIYKRPTIRHKVKNDADIETLVFRISPKMIFRGGKYTKTRFLPIFYDIYDSMAKSLTRDSLSNINHPYDIFITSQMSSTSVDDMMYCASPSTLVNLYGTTEEEFKAKIISYYKKFADKFIGNITDLTSLRIYGSDYDNFPIEASVLLKHLVDIGKRPTVVFSDRFFWSFVSTISYVSNPWYEIENGKIFCRAITKADPHYKVGLDYRNHGDIYILEEEYL